MSKQDSIIDLRQGDAFAVPLESGLWVVCRVVLDTTSELHRANRAVERIGRESVILACSKWCGPTPPDSNLEELREVLYLSHHSWQNEPMAGWCSEDVPGDVVRIGVIAPSRDDVESAQNEWHKHLCDWNDVRLQAPMQWEWDNDREGMLAREAADKAEADRRGKESYQAWLVKRRREMTLEKLAKYRFLPEWEDPIPTAVIRKSRKLLRDTAQKLLDLGQKPSTKDRLNILESCIEAFNELNAKHCFIETTEREDICDAFDMIVYACGFRRRENIADKWRDW